MLVEHFGNAACHSACMDIFALHADAPGVSQVVYPFGPDGDPDDGVQYMRVLDRRYLSPMALSFLALSHPVISIFLQVLLHNLGFSYPQGR